MSRYNKIATDDPKDALDAFFDILAKNHFVNYDFRQMFDFLIKTKQIVQSLTTDVYKEYVFNLNDELSLGHRYFDAVLAHFEESQEQALLICDKTIELVHDEQAFYNFTKDRARAFLNHEFNRQINPVKFKRCISNIRLSDNGRHIVEVKVKSSDSIAFSKESSFVYPYDRCIFIDNPFVVDSLDSRDMDFRILHGEIDEFDSNSFIRRNDIKSRDEILAELLINKKSENFFDDLEFQAKFKDVFDQINSIVPGEISKSSDGYFYIDGGARLSVKNLATGSKMFFIIKNLLLNGFIDEKTMLILDEPEAHLHPEWINKFAQILVLLASKIRVNILLTTHSPNLMLALHVFAQKMEFKDSAHFYLAETMEDKYFSRIRCIDNSIGEGYSHLALPLIEMNLELEELDGE